MTYTTHPIEPLVVKLPGRVEQSLRWAVLSDGRVFAVFESESSATAFAMHLNGWMRRNGLSASYNK